MKLILIRRWFLFALALTLFIGITFSDLFKPLADLKAIRYGIVATVMFLMAFPLKAGAIGQTLRRPGAPLLASAINFGLLPLIAWGLAAILSRLGLSDDMVLGLLVAAAVPCTLASASVWTRRAGGNDTVAILVTILTNLSCFLVTPFWLLVMSGKKVDAEELVIESMILKLGLLVVLPMMLAQLLRLVRPVGVWATERKTPLNVLAQIGVLLMVFMGSIRMGQKIVTENSGSSVLLEIIVVGSVVLLIHVLLLAIGIWSARLLGMPREDQIAVGISGSQKTLMVGLEVSLDLNVSLIPMVIYHVGQLLIDTVLADRFRLRTERIKIPARSASE